MKKTVLFACVLALACGPNPEAGSSESPGPEAAQTAADPQPSPRSSDSGAPEPRRTIAGELPDPCRLLTAEDATELLGEQVGEPRSPDAGGFPCVYGVPNSESQIVLDMYIVPGTAIDSWGMSFEACGGEIVAEPESLGVQAALWWNTAEFCGEGYSLWVQTGVYYDGPALSAGGRPIQGFIHFSLTLSPPMDQDATLEILRAAAEKAEGRLPR